MERTCLGNAAPSHPFLSLSLPLPITEASLAGSCSFFRPVVRTENSKLPIFIRVAKRAPGKTFSFAPIERNHTNNIYTRTRVTFACEFQRKAPSRSWTPLYLPYILISRPFAWVSGSKHKSGNARPFFHNPISPGAGGSALLLPLAFPLNIYLLMCFYHVMGNKSSQH